jgi:hypothetical protein
MNQKPTPAKVRLTDGLGPLAPERGRFGELMPCRMCGGKPHAYDMRGTDTHELCSVECGSCDHDVQADTPEAAATKWHAARA